MAEWPLDLSKARILITNDDGIYAPGLEVLYRIAKSLCDDVWVVAPEVEQSGAGHSLTLRRPLRIKDHGEKRFSIDGTPTDCVLMARNVIMKGYRPDLVLSGVNRAANLGEDVTYSGTVAATMEATILGIPAIAFSQCLNGGDEVHWETAEKFAPDLIKKLVSKGWPDNTLININFPAVPPIEVEGVEVVSQGRRKIGDKIIEGRDPRGEPYYWIGPIYGEKTYEEGTDLRSTADNRISVTPIDMNMTDTSALSSLKEAIG